MTLMNCFGCWNMDGVTAVKISLSKHSQKGKLKECFIAELKGLVGVNAQIASFLEVFNDKIVQYLKFNREFERDCPGFETDIHGLVQEKGADGVVRYYADCVAKDAE